jgi:hypothetical protein
MSTKDILDRIANLPAGPSDIPQVPPPELIGFVVRWERVLRHWKQSILADFACVSVSTIERVECGEKVSNEALDRIAQGLGYEPGRFTAPRYRLGPSGGPSRGDVRRNGGRRCRPDEYTSSDPRSSEL